jgi:hypothetical protein
MHFDAPLPLKLDHKLLDPRWKIRLVNKEQNSHTRLAKDRSDSSL